jgi:hypothetical protein
MHGKVQRRFLEQTAAKIRYDQENIKDAARSHDRATRERLKQLGFDLETIRTCWNI